MSAFKLYKTWPKNMVFDCLFSNFLGMSKAVLQLPPGFLCFASCFCPETNCYNYF